MTAKKKTFMVLSVVAAILQENTAEDIHVLLKTKANAGLLSQCAHFTRDYSVPETGAMYYLCESGVCKEPVKSLTEVGL